MELSRYFKSIIEQDGAPIVICNLEHTVIYMNRAAYREYGVDLVNKSIKSCHNAHSNEKIDRVVEWFKKDAENNIIYTAHSNSKNKDLYMVALRDEDGTLIGYYEKHEYRSRESEKSYNF